MVYLLSFIFGKKSPKYEALSEDRIHYSARDGYADLVIYEGKVKVSGVHNQESGPGEYDTHTVDCKQAGDELV